MKLEDALKALAEIADEGKHMFSNATLLVYGDGSGRVEVDGEKVGHFNNVEDLEFLLEEGICRNDEQKYAEWIKTNYTGNAFYTQGARDEALGAETRIRALLT